MADTRPICECGAYKFPHRVGGKCDGSAFIEYYFYNEAQLCKNCTNNNGINCDVLEGRESIQLAECYLDFSHYSVGERLPISN